MVILKDNRKGALPMVQLSALLAVSAILIPVISGCGHTEAQQAANAQIAAGRNVAPPPDAEAKALANIDSQIPPVPANLPPAEEAQAQAARAQALAQAKAQIQHSFDEMNAGANGQITTGKKNGN